MYVEKREDSPDDDLCLDISFDNAKGKPAHR